MRREIRCVPDRSLSASLPPPALPAAVNPEPLAGMGLDAGFQRGSHLAHHRLGVGMRDRGVQFHPEAQPVGLAGREERDQVGLQPEGKLGRRQRGPGGFAVRCDQRKRCSTAPTKRPCRSTTTRARLVPW